ncbi:hypothetical protein ACPPVO_33920 [Dactylosporangium sp. McL0621]|uniref:hypothetical protein n=1 Tax=Dactylosporangium sp. McL0621 TaxID=3415678 RepID=UPI003CF41A97
MLSASLPAEVLLGEVVGRVHELDAQLVERRLGRMVEPGDHDDGADDSVADAEPWADHRHLADDLRVFVETGRPSPRERRRLAADRSR